MSYLSEFLHRIGAKSRTMYNMFNLHPGTQTWIIALGIKNNQDIIEAPGLEGWHLVAFILGLPATRNNQIPTRNGVWY